MNINAKKRYQHILEEVHCEIQLMQIHKNK
jgi:hypothetical protein